MMGISELDRERFAALCAEENSNAEAQGLGIGTYAEKRLHRILKRWYASDEAEFEVNVGSFIADIKDGEHIIEIQTGSLRPLLPKLRYYLENTPYRVTVVHPIITDKTLVRINDETGELMYRRRSGKHESQSDVLPELFWISELFGRHKLSIRLPMISVEEYRYSERMRYRKEGAYVSELYPRKLLGETVLNGMDDCEIFLPSGKDSFDSASFSAFSKLKGRRLYSALNFLCAIGLVEKEAQGRKNLYKIKK